MIVGLLQLNMLHFKALEQRTFGRDLFRLLGLGFLHILLQELELAVEVQLAGTLASLALEQHGLGQLLANAHDRI